MVCAHTGGLIIQQPSQESRADLSMANARFGVLGTGVRRVVGAFQPLGGQMGVNLRGYQVGMTE